MPLVILQYLYSLQIKGDSNKKNNNFFGRLVKLHVQEIIPTQLHDSRKSVTMQSIVTGPEMMCHSHLRNSRFGQVVENCNAGVWAFLKWTNVHNRISENHSVSLGSKILTRLMFLLFYFRKQPTKRQDGTGGRAMQLCS
jgi:hypothetical protein